MRLDIVYGNSNVGKTTLCKNIVEANFLDIGYSKDFRKVSMIQIFKNMFNINNSFNYYITEACLLELNYRDRFIKEISEYIKADKVNVFYLSSYNNSNNDNSIEIGCNYGNHYIITSKKLNDRIDFIRSIN